MKLLNSTIDILLPVQVYNVHKEVVGLYVYYDASYEFFSKEHLPYAIMGVFVFITFVLSPLLLLLCYPMSFFQKCLSSCRLRNHIVHTFVDAFQGYYKDGTEPGTRDCRWFAAIYFLGRIIIFYMIFGISRNVLCFAQTGIFLIFLGVLMILLQPYKLKKLNIYHSILPLIMAVVALSITVLSELETKARWNIEIDSEIILIGIFYSLPALVAMAYVAYCTSYRCHKKCQSAYIRLTIYKKNKELSPSLITDKLNEDRHKNYQAINIE